MTTKKTKPLASLRDKSKGTISHMTIHPAKNSKGGRAFLTRIHRNPAPGSLGKNLLPVMPPPDETQHQDGQDMLDHVGRTFGVKPDDGDGDDDTNEDD